MWIYFIKKYNLICSIVLRLMYYLDIGMRAKNGEGLPVCFVYLFILVTVTINGETNPHWAKTEQKRQREGFREKIGGRALSELKSPIKKKSMTRFSWPIPLIELFVSSFSLSAGRCVWCSAISHVKQWLFQDSLIRRLFLSLKAKSIQ